MNMLAVMQFVLIAPRNPSPRLPTPLMMQTLVKRQSTHVVARYKESQIPQVRTPDFNDRVAMRTLPR